MHRAWKSRRTRFAVAGAVALTFGVLASLGGVSYAAKLVGVTGASPVAAQYPPSKVTICHHTHSQKNPFVTITISERALPAHLRHGDTIGPCPAVAAVTAKAAVKGHKANKPQHSNHKGKKSHPTGKGHSALKNTLKGNSGHGHGHGQSGTHGNAKHQQPVQSQVAQTTKGHGKGHANGHAKTHGHASTTGQGHAHDQGNGHGNGASNGHGNGGGNGHGNGASNGHGNNGGGGKGHQK